MVEKKQGLMHLTPTPGEISPLYTDKDKEIINATLTSKILTEKYKNYQPEFILNPLIFKNGNNIIGAERGTGKTRLALSISFAILYGFEEFIGYSINERGNILYLNYEIQEPEFKLFVEPIENYYKSNGEKKHEFYSISFKSYPNLKIKDVEYAISEYKPMLVIVDSFKAFSTMLLRELGEKEINNSNMKVIYDVFDNWRRCHNTTNLILNHLNKGTKASVSHSDLMFGPSAFMDYADHTTLMRKTNVANQRLIIPDKCRFAREGSTGTNLIEIDSSDDGQEIWFELKEEDVKETDYLYKETGGTQYSEDDKNWVIKLKSEGKSCRDISNLTKVPKSTVQRWIKKIEVELETQSLQSVPNF